MTTMLGCAKRCWRLQRAIAASVADAFCFDGALPNAAVRLLCLPFVLELTRLGIKMEAMIERDGDLQGASRWLIEVAARGIHIHNADNVPLAGPVLFVGNHAGLGDANALLMSSPRRDTQVLAHYFGILPGLDKLQQHLIVVDRDNPLAALRASLRHLQAGRSILMYPRGAIEADPGLHLDAALASLPEWSRSIDFFVRHVPDLAVVPFAVGGVISRRALRNVMVRQYRDADERHFLAATFQMLFSHYRDPLVSLFYGRALYGEAAVRDAILAQMGDLLRAVYAEQQRFFNLPADG